MAEARVDQFIREARIQETASARVDQFIRETRVPVGTFVVSITVTPSNAFVFPGGTKQYIANAIFNDTGIVDITALVVWSSSVPEAATVSASGGLATGVARGNTIITATFGLISGSTSLFVSGPFRQDLWVTQATGQSIVNAEVWVCNQPAVVPPGLSAQAPAPGPLANIFRDIKGFVPIVQPILTDGLGHAAFYVLPGTYTIAQYFPSSRRLFHVYPDQSIGLTG